MNRLFYEFESVFAGVNTSQFEELGIVLDAQNEDNFSHGIIYLDISQIEVFNQSDMEGYVTFYLNSGYNGMIKTTIEKLIELLNELDQ